MILDLGDAPGERFEVLDRYYSRRRYKLLDLVYGRRPAHVLWRDTLLLEPRARGAVALVADNPGRWMLHRHIPEHQEAGMMAVVEVS